MVNGDTTSLWPVHTVLSWMHVVDGAAQYSILLLELIYYIVSEMLTVFTTPYDNIVCQ